MHSPTEMTDVTSSVGDRQRVVVQEVEAHTNHNRNISDDNASNDHDPNKFDEKRLVSPLTSSSTAQHSVIVNHIDNHTNNDTTLDESIDSKEIHDEEKRYRPPSSSAAATTAYIKESNSTNNNTNNNNDSGSFRRRDSDQQSQTSYISLENSPIEEVRATVPNTDDPTLPTNTFRMWVLSLFFTAIVAFVNQFFYLRQNPVSITYTVVSLISLPMGRLMAKILPRKEWSWFGEKYKFSLNPGPFNIKEHVLIGTAVACASSTAYAVDIVILQTKYYNDDKGFLAGFLLVLTTQITGFSLAGVLRKFLVRPAAMIWPANLVTVALFRTLHEDHSTTTTTTTATSTSSQQEQQEGSFKKQQPTRLKYFLMISGLSFCWYWFPNFIMPSLTALSILCWINPKNIILSQLTGSNGLGIGTLSLDWATSTSALAPLVTPWWAQVNIMVGFILFAWIMAPVAYYLNLWNSKNFPILTAELYRQDGTEYDIKMVMSDNVLDQEKYEAYGPMYMDSFFALTYLVGFAGLTATLTHVGLYNGQEILQQWRSARLMRDHDIHSRMMLAYEEVPQWWYTLLFVLSLTLSIITVTVWNYLPWYYLLLALAIAFIFALPVGVVQAVTNQQPGLNVITEYVIGYLMPGHPIANVTFKTYGYITNVQALQFTQDLKLGHYMKIPPKLMFWVQVMASVLAGLINLSTTLWLLRVQPNICTKEGYPWTCRTTSTFYSASVIWGVIGPERMFGSGSIYSIIQWGFLIGFLLPIPVWYLTRKYPKHGWFKYIHIPVALAATSNMPPNQAYFYPNGLLLGFIFMFYLKRYHSQWWEKYNYITSAAMDTGVAISGLVCYFVLQGNGIKFPDWWGTAEDYDHCPLGSANFYGDIN